MMLFIHSGRVVITDYQGVDKTILKLVLLPCLYSIQQ